MANCDTTDYFCGCLQLTAIGASWIDLAERFFAVITTNQIERAAFAAEPEREEASQRCFLHHCTGPKPFVWTNPARTIPKKKRRAPTSLQAVKPEDQEY